MTKRIRIATAQLNPVLGALEENAARAAETMREAHEAGADIVVFPEMFIGGYQLQDLVDKPAFIESCDRVVRKLAAETKDLPPALIGLPLMEDGKEYNCVYVFEGGEVKTIIRKHELPNYGVFDEERFYVSGAPSGPVEIAGVRIGVAICEDIWFPDVCETLQESGAEIIISPNGSPYARNKYDQRMQVSVARVIETGLPLLYVNLLGGQDDQVFDGGSFALNPGGQLAMQAPFFEEALVYSDWENGADGWRCVEAPMGSVADSLENDYRAMMMATRDYVTKNGFKQVVLGLSGGVDSALVATIAADALGPQNVWTIMLPSKYTSEHSLEDAAALAMAQHIPYATLPISGGVDAIGEGLDDFFKGTEPGIAEENIQSRLRGLYLMALSNKFGHMLLTTGNKSEVAVGYATLYGDMNGGYNPLKDLYKTRVFDVCRWRNETYRDWMLGNAGEVIPERIITKPPSAELREDQKDEDSLPPYEVLDGILEMLIEGDASIGECVAAGYDVETVEKIERLLYISEYKRFQSAPGVKLGTKAFHLERRYPMTNRFRDRLHR